MRIVTRRRSRLQPVSTIPASSVADIAFLLVVFFALIAHEPDRSVVELPSSRVQIGAEEDAALVVLAYDRDESGKRSLAYKFSDGQKESQLLPGPEEVGGEATRLLAADPKRQFRLKADGGVPCREIGRTLDALTKSGAKEVVMVTTPDRTEVP